MDPFSSSLNVNIQQQETKRATATFHSLHSVRKPQGKPWRKPILPPPRVYTVDASNFRQVVQKLTGAPEFQSRRLKSVAPAPLNLTVSPPSDYNVLAKVHPLPSPSTLSEGVYSELPSNTPAEEPKNFLDCSPAMTTFGLMSPSWYSWCSLPLLSPGALVSAEQSIVL